MEGSPTEPSKEDEIKPPTPKELNFYVITFLGALCGLVGGLAGVFVRWTVTNLKYVVIGLQEARLLWLVFMCPLIGVFIGSVLSNRFAPEIKGSGIPELINSVKVNKGDISPKVPLLKMIATPLHVGLGAIGGIEGPIAQIGGSFGSIIGKKFKLNSRGRTLLVTCGMTGGVASTFNTPIGGLFFGVELMYNMSRLLINTLVPIILASVLATTISWIVFGYDPVITAPQFTFEGFSHLPVYLIFGVLAGFYGVGWVLFFSKANGFFERLKITPYLKPVITALFSAVSIIFIIDILDVEHSTLEKIIDGQYSLGFLILAFAIISFGAAITIGSGSVAGLFSPSLLIGALFGGIMGRVVNLIIPGFFDNPNKMALIGSAAFFAGMARTPLTNIIMIFEMTLNYRLILPLMVSVVSSYLIHWWLLREKNLYTINLIRRYQIPDDQWKKMTAMQLLAEVPVMEVMTPAPKVKFLNANAPKEETIETVKHKMFNVYPVMDNKGNLKGVIRAETVIAMEPLPDEEFKLLKHLESFNPIVFPDDSIQKCLELMESYEVKTLMVVHKEDLEKLEGLVTKGDIFKAYQLVHSKTDLLEY